MQVKKNVKLPIGTKVRVRADLNKDKEYDGNGVNRTMMEMAGKVVTIKYNSGWNDGGYGIKGDMFSWTYDMLEYIEKEDAFEMLLNGQINDNEYKEMTTEVTL